MGDLAPGRIAMNVRASMAILQYQMTGQEQSTLITLVSPSGTEEPPDELLVLLLLALGLRRLPFLLTFVTFWCAFVQFLRGNNRSKIH